MSVCAVAAEIEGAALMQHRRAERYGFESKLIQCGICTVGQNPSAGPGLVGTNQLQGSRNRAFRDIDGTVVAWFEGRIDLIVYKTHKGSVRPVGKNGGMRVVFLTYLSSMKWSG